MTTGRRTHFLALAALAVIILPFIDPRLLASPGTTKQQSLDEWHRVLPAEFEPAKMAEVEQKISALKRRLAQQKPPTDPKP